MEHKIIAFEQTERIALKITRLLEGLAYQDISNILIVVDRIVKDNAVFEKVISIEKPKTEDGLSNS